MVLLPGGCVSNIKAGDASSRRDCTCYSCGGRRWGAKSNLISENNIQYRALMSMDIAIAVREKAKAAASRKQCMSDGSVSIKQLVKTYVDDRGRPTFTAVKKISLNIADGEFMVLVGPSGCGKSTTLRMVAGLEPSSTVSGILF